MLSFSSCKVACVLFTPSPAFVGVICSNADPGFVTNIDDATTRTESPSGAKVNTMRSAGTLSYFDPRSIAAPRFLGLVVIVPVRLTRIDRLARSIGDLQDIVRSVKAKGASLKATEQPIDTSTAAGKAFLDMLGVFAEFETNLRRERQMEDIAKAKAAGVYKGRPASIDAAQVRELKASGKGPSEIAETLGIGRASVYRALGPAS